MGKGTSHWAEEKSNSGKNGLMLTCYQGLRVNFPPMEIFQSVYDSFPKHTLSSSSLTVRSEMGVSLVEIL